MGLNQRERERKKENRGIHNITDEEVDWKGMALKVANQICWGVPGCLQWKSAMRSGA